MKSNKIPWPTIVDSSRKFEEACGVNEISLSNIYQVKYITAHGELKRGNFKDLDGVVKSALEDARWKIQPNDIPSKLRPAWRSIEFGDFQAAGKDISRALESKDADLKSAAKHLEAFARKEIKRQGNVAMKLAREGEFWPAYQEIDRLCTTFASYNLPDKIIKAKQILEGKDIVKAELRADKKLQAALELGSKKRTVSIAKKRLTSIIEDFPDTEAANLAREKLGVAN